MVAVQFSLARGPELRSGLAIQHLSERGAANRGTLLDFAPDRPVITSLGMVWCRLTWCPRGFQRFNESCTRRVEALPALLDRRKDCTVAA